MWETRPATTPSRQLALGLSAKWLMLPLLLCFSVIPAGIAYIAAGYNRVAAWYRGLNPCFYRSADWQDAFFTRHTYKNGAFYAGAAILIAAALCVWIWRQLRGGKAWTIRLRFSSGDRFAMLGLWLFQAAIWTYGLLKCVPGYDEVFSAMNCAGMHPFQCASYYMLPNNHVFFNLLNSVVGRLGTDPLLSARLIAAGMAFAFTPLLYLWIRGRNTGLAVAVCVTALVLLQFPVWAFGFQGRGYTLYLLCAWTGFVSLQYYFETGNRGAWLPHILATLVGFWTMPSYLYWELALGLYAVVEMLRARRVDWSVFGYMALSAAAVFLAYVPMLCFSGLPSITQNRYVVAPDIPLLKFVADLKSNMLSSVQYTFNGWVEHRSIAYTLCFAIPFLLTPFLYKRKVFTTLLLLWFSWGLMILGAMYSKRFPFPRNLIAHVSLSLVALLLVAQEILRLLPDRLRLARTGAMIAACLLMGIHFARFDREHIHDSIYFYQAETRYQSLHAAAERLPPNATVWVSTEGFYWEYLCMHRGLRASMCEGPAATHYIHIGGDEPVPAEIRDRVDLVDSADEYRILKIRH